MLPWIDLETSGLSAIGCCPLELAILITTDDLEIIDHRVWLIKPTFDPDTWDPFVREMHTKSGLIKDLKMGTKSILEVEAEACKFLREHGIDGTQPLCGSSVGFDRKFLDQWMPQLAAAFHYRNIDVSSIKEAAQRWAPDLRYPSVPNEMKAHRAVPDVYESVAEAKYYRTGIFIPAQQLVPGTVTAARIANGAVTGGKIT